MKRASSIISSILYISTILGLAATTIILNNKLLILQERMTGLSDLNDGMYIHLQFVDSDNKRMQESLVAIRRDLDEHKFLNSKGEK